MRKKLILFIVLLMAKASAVNILGIGSPSVDILLHVDDDFLRHIPGEKGGSLNIDWYHFSKIMEQGRTKNPFIVAGGSCANMLKGLASLDETTRLFGKIGRDEMGKFFLNSVIPLGIEARLIFSDTPTQQVLCLITPDKNRTMRVFAGAGQEMTEEDLNSEVFTGVQHVHIEGYALYNGMLVEEAMRMAKEMGATVSFDLGSFELVGLFRKSVLNLLTKYVDIVFANSDEAKALTGFQAEEACCAMKDLCPVAVVLVGSDGCFVGHDDQCFRIPVSYVDAIETTGAGDLFASGFLYGYLNQCSLKRCAEYGNLLGSTVVTYEGAEIPQKAWKEIKEKMRQLP